VNLVNEPDPFHQRTAQALDQLCPTEIFYWVRSYITILMRVAHWMTYFDFSKLNSVKATVLKTFESSNSRSSKYGKAVSLYLRYSKKTKLDRTKPSTVPHVAHMPSVLDDHANLRRFHQARNQLGTPGGAKSFPSGAKIFWTMSNIFKMCPTHSSRGREFF